MGYKKQGFKDRIYDADGNVTQEGTELHAEHLIKIEDAILANEQNSSGNSLQGLNVLCLGDSITVGQGISNASEKWTNILKNKYGWNLTVNAAGGIGLSSYYYTLKGETDVSICKKAESISSMSVKPDIVTVWGGHNDTTYRYSPVGTWGDDTNSFKGALKHIAEQVHTYAPKATLFVLSQEWYSAPITLKVPEGTTDTEYDFDKAIFEGAYKYGWIPINMRLCGITQYTKNTYTSDGIHPNASGAKLIADYLEHELAKHYRIK